MSARYHLLEVSFFFQAIDWLEQHLSSPHAEQNNGIGFDAVHSSCAIKTNRFKLNGREKVTEGEITCTL